MSEQLNKNEPQDPLTQMAEAAASAHELFRSYVDAGFTEQQALYLVSQFISNALRGRALE